jgi:hypothetical protein
VAAGGFAVSAILAQRALSMELLPSDGIAGETSDAEVAMVGAQQATETQNDPDLRLGTAICIFSAAITCGGAYLLTDILFF